MIDSVEVWNPNTESFQASAPDIWLGQNAGLFVACTNEEAVAQYMRVDADVLMPNGDSFYQTGMTKGFIQPGSTEFWYEYLWWPCGFEGLYRADVVLFSGVPGGLEEIDRVSVDVALVRVVNGPEPDGKTNKLIFAGAIGLSCLGILLLRRKK